jgi:Fe-S cluster biogenesis protein NfuA
VADEKEFRQRVQEIGKLIADLDEITDNKARTSARVLVQLVMELHGTAMERVMEIIFSKGDAGAEIIDALGRDRVSSGLLVLHNLHPEHTDTRVSRAIEEVAMQLRKQEVEVRLTSFEAGVVTVHAQTSAHACGSTAATVRTSIEEAVYEAAPEIASLAIEGLESKAASGFVGINQLMSAPVDATLMESKAAD